MKYYHFRLSGFSEAVINSYLGGAEINQPESIRFQLKQT